ncbi:MAG: ATP-dependent DNA helicase RecG [Anaerolineales bacterium]
MNPALDKLDKFFRLEAERNYDNRAVLGGLDKVLDSWTKEARESGLSEDLIQLVAKRLQDYARLPAGSRAEVLLGIRHRLGLPTVPTATQEQPTATAIPEGEESPPTVSPAVPRPDTVAVTPPAASAVSSRPSAEADLKALQSPLTVIQGIGPATSRRLEHIGLRTLGDLLWDFPRRFDDYSSLKPIQRLWYGEVVTVIGLLEKIESRRTHGGQGSLVEAVLSDGSGSLRVTWFNQPWLVQRLKPGDMLALSGRIDQYLGRLTMSSPEWEPLDRQQVHTRGIIPVYGLTSGIHQKWFRNVMQSTVRFWSNRLPDPLPEAIRREGGWMPLGEAVQQAHFPSNWEALRSAQKRLAFDELFYLQLGVLQQKRDWQSVSSPQFFSPEGFDAWKRSLGYTLTHAQETALGEIEKDLASGRPMNRLLQGDVGSGKTVVAVAAAHLVASGGGQVAVLAPTSILAEQHHHTFLSLLCANGGDADPLLPRPYSSQEVQLLLGATPEAEKERIRAGAASGTIRILIGTHALLEPGVRFANLALAVVDEQHRFGVAQRSALRSKGTTPHLLVMTATPIPRSLALTIYGDLDLSLLDEKPPGRQPVTTRVMLSGERDRAYGFIARQLEKGRQAFVICPLVEESESVEATAAVEEHERLRKQVFPRWRLGLLHGKMKAEEKETVMEEFRQHELDVLVSTSVVELGVDIPNATVIMVEGADRFGLAQLHQFRGRVGRGADPAYCLLVAETEDAADNERLKAMEETSDGFALAEHDLDQRGPGEFLGTRQSGFADLRMAKLTDLHLVELARSAAQQVFREDPELRRPEHQLMAERLAALWKPGQGEVS